MNGGLEISAFDGFFTATAAGFAALLGLLFVAFTLRWHEIASDERLRFTAVGSTQAMVGGLVVSLCVLLPGQTHDALGWEIIGATIVFVLAAAPPTWRLLRRRPIPVALWFRVASAPVVAIVAGVAGLSLIVGQGPGLYIEAALFITAFPVVTWNAWEAIWPPVGYRAKHDPKSRK